MLNTEVVENLSFIIEPLKILPACNFLHFKTNETFYFRRSSVFSSFLSTVIWNGLIQVFGLSNFFHIPDYQYDVLKSNPFLPWK